MVSQYTFERLAGSFSIASREGVMELGNCASDPPGLLRQHASPKGELGVNAL